MVRLVEELKGLRGDMEAGLGFATFRNHGPAHVRGRGREVATGTECLLVSEFLAQTALQRGSKMKRISYVLFTWSLAESPRR